MKIVIDAWLERKDPQIRFLDGDNASVLMQVGPALTQRLLDHGEISVEDLQNPRNHDLAAMVFMDAWDFRRQRSVLTCLPLNYSTKGNP